MYILANTTAERGNGRAAGGIDEQTHTFKWMTKTERDKQTVRQRGFISAM